MSQWGPGTGTVPGVPGETPGWEGTDGCPGIWGGGCPAPPALTQKSMLKKKSTYFTTGLTKEKSPPAAHPAMAEPDRAGAERSGSSRRDGRRAGQRPYPSVNRPLIGPSSAFCLPIGGSPRRSTAPLLLPPERTCSRPLPAPDLKDQRPSSLKGQRTLVLNHVMSQDRSRIPPG